MFSKIVLIWTNCFNRYDTQEKHMPGAYETPTGTNYSCSA